MDKVMSDPERSASEKWYKINPVWVTGYGYIRGVSRGEREPIPMDCTAWNYISRRYISQEMR